MIFTETRLPGAYVVELDVIRDDRGFFARAFCQREFTAAGLAPVIVQANVSFNYRKGTVRGMHFQYPPAGETKLVRCTRGAIADVIVDLRPESPTYLEHLTVELSADNRRGLYIPKRFAHGYQALDDNTETTYLVDEFYTPGAEDGLACDDPRLAIAWPLPVANLSAKDRQWASIAAREESLRARMRTVNVEQEAAREAVTGGNE